MKCSATNKKGKQCGAPAMEDTKRCVMHSGRAAELGSKGGRRRAIYYSPCRFLRQGWEN
jgi:hypothetical protein